MFSSCSLHINKTSGNTQKQTVHGSQRRAWSLRLVVKVQRVHRELQKSTFKKVAQSVLFKRSSRIKHSAGVTKCYLPAHSPTTTGKSNHVIIEYPDFYELPASTSIRLNGCLGEGSCQSNARIFSGDSCSGRGGLIRSHGHGAWEIHQR